MNGVRANLIASNAPPSFWTYAATHHIDALNRATGPPIKDTKSSYEIASLGDEPRIMDILPFGCRAFAVKDRSEYRKEFLEGHAHVGINLGRSKSTC